MNTTIRNYETLYIVDSTLTDEQTEAIISKYSTLITEQDGEVQAAGKWDRRRLAYEIKGRREGLYILMYFSGEPAVEKELDRVFRISDEVVRHIILRIEPERVDTSRIERPAPSPEHIVTERAGTTEAPEAVEVSEAPEAEEAAPEAQTQETPTEETPAEETPAEETPTEETPTEETPTEETPAEEARTEEAPAQEPEPAVGEAPAEEPAGE